MGLIAVSSNLPGVNNPPIWNSTPSVEFEDGVSGTYDLSQNCSDPDNDSITYTLNGGSASLPSGITISGTNLSADGTQVEGTTTGIIIDADDGTASPVASSSFSIVIQAAGAESPAPTIVVANSGGDYTHAQLQTALDAAGPGDVVEIQADTPGGTNYINVALILTTSGDSNDAITCRTRLGDTIVLYNNSDDHIMVPDNNSYWYYLRVQFGRDETLNGWEYTTTDPTKGKFGVEHRSCVRSEGETSSHIVFDTCRFYGGKNYDAVYADVDTSYWGAINCTVSHCGVNVESSTPDFGANGIHFRGKHCFIQDSTAEYVGHNGLQLEGQWSVLLRNFCEGDWSAYNSGTGNRTVGIVGDKGPFPYGPILSEGNICRNAKPEAGSGDPSPATKFHSYRGITRRNYIFDNSDQAIQWTPQSGTGIAAMDYNRFYFNTFYNCGWLAQSTDNELKTSWNNHGIECVWKNNIIQEQGTGRAEDSSHFRWVRTNSSDGAYSNGWRGLVFTENIFHVAADDDTEKVRLQGTGSSQEVGLTNIEAQWTEFNNNQATETDFFLGTYDRQSDNYATVIAAFEIDSLSGPPGLGDAVHLTLADGLGISSANLTVDDSLYFVALSDTNTWNLSWFSQFGFDVRDDYIQVGGTSPGNGGTVAQILSINYNTHQITLTSNISWSNNDIICLYDHDGVTPLQNYGAHT